MSKTKAVLENPLANINWPEVDNESEISEAIIGLLKPAQPFFEWIKAGSNPPDPPRPEILKHVSLGFNNVMKDLEEQAQAYLLSTYTSAEAPQDPFKAICVCRSDMPAILTMHLPMLSATSRSQLITLKKGSSARLSNITSEDTFVMALKKSQLTESIFEMSSSIAVLDLSWLGHTGLPKASIKVIELRKKSKDNKKGGALKAQPDQKVTKKHAAGTDKKH